MMLSTYLLDEFDECSSYGLPRKHSSSSSLRDPVQGRGDAEESLNLNQCLQTCFLKYITLPWPVYLSG